MGPCGVGAVTAGAVTADNSAAAGIVGGKATRPAGDFSWAWTVTWNVAWAVAWAGACAGASAGAWVAAWTEVWVAAWTEVWDVVWTEVWDVVCVGRAERPVAAAWAARRAECWAMYSRRNVPSFAKRLLRVTWKRLSIASSTGGITRSPIPML